MSPKIAKFYLPVCLSARYVFHELTGKTPLPRTSEDTIRSLIAKTVFARRIDNKVRAKYMTLLLQIYFDLDTAIKDLIIRRRMDLYTCEKYLSDPKYHDAELLNRLTTERLSNPDVRELHKVFSSIRADVKLHVELVTAATTASNLSGKS